MAGTMVNCIVSALAWEDSVSLSKALHGAMLLVSSGAAADARVAAVLGNEVFAGALSALTKVSNESEYPYVFALLHTILKVAPDARKWLIQVPGVTLERVATEYDAVVSDTKKSRVALRKLLEPVTGLHIRAANVARRRPVILDLPASSMSLDTGAEASGGIGDFDGGLEGLFDE